MIRKMKFFAVLETANYGGDADPDTTLFVKLFTTKKLAIAAIELAARETWDQCVDPNDGEDHTFPGVEGTDYPNSFFCDALELSWEIVEVTT